MSLVSKKLFLKSSLINRWIPSRVGYNFGNWVKVVHTGLSVANPRFFAIDGENNFASLSIDGGESWNTAPDLPSEFLQPNYFWKDVSHAGPVDNNDRYVAVNTNNTTTNYAAYATTGPSVWTRVTTLPFPSTSVTYGGRGFWVIASGTSSSAYSLDFGINWTSISMPSSRNWSAITSGAGRYVAVASGSTSAAYTNVNGLTWLSSTLPLSRLWNSVAYGNGIFVAVAGDDTGSVFSAYSNDGSSWVSGGSGLVLGRWQAITFGGGFFMAVGNGNLCAFSEDGVNWYYDRMPENKSWKSIAYGIDRFLALASDGTVAYKIIQ